VTGDDYPQSCSFCGKNIWSREPGVVLEFAGGFLDLPDLPFVIWDGCEEGRAGFADAQRAERRGLHRKWIMDTPIYAKNKPCPKCGNPIRGAILHQAEFFTGLTQGLFGPPTEYFLNRCPGRLEWEHLVVKCGVCMFEQIMVPMDVAIIP
jgi:hypothetical protein